MKTGIIISNIGSPKTTKISDVRKYLAEFLMDASVLDIPFLKRLFVVYCFILPFRPKRSAEAYKSIWLKNGSPLVVYTQELVDKLKTKLKNPIEVGMRYQDPSLLNAIDKLVAENSDLKEILLCPMFPQYAMSTTEGIINYAKAYIQKKHPSISMSNLNPFYSDPDYIDVLSESLKPYLKEDYDHILLSYHGLPVRHLIKTDPSGMTCAKINDCCKNGSPEVHSKCYKAQTVKTSELLMKKAGVPDEKWSLSYQSRLGRDPWIEPATDTSLEKLAKQGIKKLLVICPAFITDCLETLEEIEIEGKEIFLEHGGDTFTYIPCLNSGDKWVDYLSRKINKSLKND